MAILMQTYLCVQTFFMTVDSERPTSFRNARRECLACRQAGLSGKSELSEQNLELRIAERAFYFLPKGF